MPVPGLTHLETSAVEVTLAGRPVKILAAYLSPFRPLVGADLTACFGGELPVLMAGALNAKHVDWNSQLTTRRGKLIRDYADENSCLIFGPDTPTTNPYSPSATPDVLDIAMTKDLPFPVYLTSCSALSSDHLPVLIDTACRSSFHQSPDRPNFRRTDLANFRPKWKIIFRSIWYYTMGWPSTHALRISPAPYCRLWRHLLPNVAQVTSHGLRYRPAFWTKYT